MAWKPKKRALQEVNLKKFKGEHAAVPPDPPPPPPSLPPLLEACAFDAHLGNRVSIYPRSVPERLIVFLLQQLGCITFPWRDLEIGEW